MFAFVERWGWVCYVYASVLESKRGMMLLCVNATAVFLFFPPLALHQARDLAHVPRDNKRGEAQDGKGTHMW